MIHKNLYKNKLLLKRINWIVKINMSKIKEIESLMVGIIIVIIRIIIIIIIIIIIQIVLIITRISIMK